MLFDVDGSGSIDNTELTAAMKVMGFEAGEQDVANMIAAVDMDGNGTVELDEFVEMMKRVMVRPSPSPSPSRNHPHARLPTRA